MKKRLDKKTINLLTVNILRLTAAFSITNICLILGNTIEKLKPSLSLFFIRLELHKNYGASFNIFSKNPLVVNITGSLIVLLLIGLMLSKKSAPWFSNALMLTIGGACANLTERILSLYVTDYIKIGTFPVFNLADILISLSLIYIGFKYIIKNEEMFQGKNKCK